MPFRPYPLFMKMVGTWGLQCKDYRYILSLRWLFLQSVVPKHKVAHYKVGKAKPPIGTYGLAAKAQHKVAIVAVRERKSKIENVNMVLLASVRFLNGKPHRKRVGVIENVTLLHGCIEPQHRFTPGVHNHASAHHSPLVKGNVDVSVLAVAYLLKQLFLRYVALLAQSVVSFYKAIELVNLGFTFGFACFKAAFHSTFHTVEHLFRGTFLRGFAVQRVVQLNPRNRYEAVSAKCSVAKHLFRDIAQLYMVATMAQQMAHKSVHHRIEKLAFLRIINAVSVDTFAINACPMCKTDAQKAAFAANVNKNLPDGFAIFVDCNHHTRLQSWRLFQHTEQVATVKEIAFAERRQVFAACYNLGSHLYGQANRNRKCTDKSAHATCKNSKCFVKKREMRSFSPYFY